MGSPLVKPNAHSSGPHGPWRLGGGDGAGGITRVTGDDEFLYFVGDPVTDPTLLAAHADRIGEGEQLFRFRSRVIPEVAP